LLPLSALLHQHGVAHRIFEEGGQQVVMVMRAQQAQQVQDLYRAWRAGQVRIDMSRQEQPEPASSPAIHWQLAPITLILVLLSVCGFLLVYLQAPNSWLNYMTFTPFRMTNGQLLFGSMDGQYWRLVTPVFL